MYNVNVNGSNLGALLHVCMLTSSTHVVAPGQTMYGGLTNLAKGILYITYSMDNDE